MHVVGPHIEEKGLVLVPGDELRGLQGDRVGDAFVDPQRRTASGHPSDARNAVDDRVVMAVARTQLQQFGILGPRRPVADLVVIIHRDRIGGVQPHDTAVFHENARHAVDRGRDEVFVIETYIAGIGTDLDVEIRAADRTQTQMPFANGARDITGIVHGVGERMALRVDDEFGISRSDLRIGKTPWVHARQQAETRWRTGGGGGIGIGETLPLSRKTVDMGRSDPRRSVTAQVADTEVVGEDEDDIRTGIFRDGNRRVARTTPCKQGNYRRSAKRDTFVHGSVKSLKVLFKDKRQVNPARSGLYFLYFSPTEIKALLSKCLHPIVRVC